MGRDNIDFINLLFEKLNIKYTYNKLGGFKFNYNNTEVDLWLTDDLLSAIQYNVDGLFFNLKDNYNKYLFDIYKSTIQPPKLNPLFYSNYLYYYGNILDFNVPTNEEFKMLEYLLVEKMPNLVITHHDTDTTEDLSNQLKKVKDILERGMLPYFMDFSMPKQNVKKDDIVIFFLLNKNIFSYIMSIE